MNDENRSFELFVSAVDEFTREVKTLLELKERKDAPRKPPRKIDIENPKESQKLYKLNRRKALRLIYGDDSEFCGLDPDIVADFFDVVGEAELGINYKGWRSIDPEAVVLADIFNLCLIFEKIPDNWKITTIILIYKKGERSDQSNWRNKINKK